MKTVSNAAGTQHVIGHSLYRMIMYKDCPRCFFKSVFDNRRQKAFKTRWS